MSRFPVPTPTRHGNCELGGFGEDLPYKVFCSPPRDLALVMCGWSFATARQSLEEFIKRFEREREGGWEGGREGGRVGGREGGWEGGRGGREGDGLRERQVDDKWIIKERDLDHLFDLCDLYREEAGGRYERAAAVSVFQGHLRRGIQSLTGGAALARHKGDSERG